MLALTWSLSVLFCLSYSQSDYPDTTTKYNTWGIDYRCLWHNNECVSACPDWMVEVKSNCSQSHWLAQRTCDNPEPRFVGTVCGFSRCDCPNTMILDSDTGFCFEEDNCPTNHTVNYELVI